MATNNLKLDPRSLYEEGLKLASEIKRLEEQILTSQGEIFLSDRKISEYKDEIAQAVVKATDDEGKKKYPNDTARKIAVNNLLRDNLNYQKTLEIHRDLVNTNKINRIEISYRERLFKLVTSLLTRD